jgi:hypothetical protein
MIVGQSIFDSVLDKLTETPTDEPAGKAAPWTGIRGLNAGFVGASSEALAGQSEAQFSNASSAYFAEDIAPPQEPEIDTAIYARLSPVEIAEELDLSSADTMASLQAKRRDFARTNHPDRAPEAWREQATTRMKTANLLIDQALKQAMLKQR